MRLFTPGFIAAALCAWPIATSAPTSAQTQPTTSEISDQKLDAAAAAMARVSDIQKSYEQKLAKADPSEQDRVIEEANSALVGAVTDQGLSVDEYSTILKTAQNDPSVRERLIQRLNK